MLDLNLFRVFDAIYSERSITRAGLVLHRSQPALSYSLSRLRAHFGDELFVRRGNRLAPTPLARAMIGPVRQALAALASVSGAARHFDPAVDRADFRIAMREPLESTVLPGIITRVREQAPAVTVAAVRAAHADIAARLAAGTLDLAIDVRISAGAGIQQLPLLSDRFVVVAATAQRSAVTAPEYLEAAHVLVSSREEGLGVEDYGLRRLGHSRQVVMRCQTYLAACLAVARSDLLVTLPYLQARQLVQRIDGLAHHEMPFTLPAVDLSLYWHQRVDADPANRWLRDLLVEMAAAPSLARP